MTQLRFGFIGWNPFQFRHALDIARALPGSAMIVEARGKHPEAFDDALITEAGVPVYFWPARRMRELDGVCEVIVCQTVFTHIEHFRKSRSYAQYGLAKEPLISSWRAFADLCLVYGPYSARRSRHMRGGESASPIRGFFGSEFQTGSRALQCGSRPGATHGSLYADTGELSRDQFIDAVLELSTDHNVS